MEDYIKIDKLENDIIKKIYILLYNLDMRFSDTHNKEISQMIMNLSIALNNLKKAEIKDET